MKEKKDISTEFSVTVKELITANNINRSSKRNDSDRMSVGDVSVVSALTMDEELRTMGGQSMYTTRESLSHAANKPVITSRISMEARMSDRSKELGLNNLKLQQLPLFGRQKELEDLSKAFSRIQNGGRGLLLVGGVSGTGKTSLIEHISFQKKVRSEGGIFISAKCDLREQNEPLASVQDAMSLLSDRILALRRREDPTSTVTRVNLVSDTIPEDSSGQEGRTPTKSLTTSSASVRTCGSGTRSDVSTLEDVQEKLAAELTDNEWKVLIQTVPAMEALIRPSDSPVDPAPTVTLRPRSSDEFLMKGDGTGFSATISTSSNPKMDGASMKENSDQMKYAYRHFIRVVATLCPLVVVFDDCQWQDAASMEWIKSILTDADTEKTLRGRTDKIGGLASLLIISSYRSEEVGDDHRLVSLTKELKAIFPLDNGCSSKSEGGKTEAPLGVPLFVRDIQLGNLQVHDIVCLLEELLNSNKPDVVELAEILHQKTAGNSFFVVQFLMRLKEDHRFSFSIGLMKWTWDCAEIRKSYTATSNVADFLADRMKKSGEALAILPIAAALGDLFSLEALQAIVDHIKKQSLETNGSSFMRMMDCSNSVAHPLDKCVDEGLLETTPEGMYKFSHDKILETALSFLNVEVKRCIADYFLENFDQEEEQFGDAFYPLLSLVNQRVKDFAASEEKNFRVVQLNALAGEKALQCAAFEPASEFLSNAMSCLPKDHWTAHRDLSLRIFVLAGAAAFNAGAGHRDRVKEYTDELLAQPNVALLDKVDMCYTMMDVYDAAFTAEGNQSNYEFGISLLKEFGCRFPKSSVGALAKTVTGLMGAKFSLKKKLSPQALETMPISSDRKIIALMKILDKFTNIAFHTRTDLVPLVMFRQLQYTDQYGLSPYAAITYPTLGMIFCTMQDFESARVCAQAGLTILERCHDQSMASRCHLMVYVYTIHWTTPLNDVLKPLLEGYKIGMTTGTLYGAFYCVAFYVEFNFWTGVELTTLYADCATYLRQMEDYDSFKHAAFLNSTRHMISRLIGFTDDSEEGDFEAFFMEKGDIPMMCALRRAQIYAGCFLDQHQRAADLGLEWQPIIQEKFISQVSILEITFATSLSCMAVLRQSEGRAGRKYMNMAAKCRKLINSYVAKSCPNCVAHAALLDAEWAVLKKEKRDLRVKFEQAVLLAGRRGLIHLQALANERLAIYMEEIRDPVEAYYRYEQAIGLYVEWGAKAKVDKLQLKLDSMKKEGITSSLDSIRGLSVSG